MSQTCQSIEKQKNPEQGGEFYKSLDALKAIEVIEEERASEEEVIIAWQYIYDTGLYRSLQGYYGRMVHVMLKAGIIS
jgi:hypothetical protein